MAPLLSELSTFFSWLLDYTIDISILICFIFIIKSIAAKKLPAWWHYSLWIILIVRMVIPLELESPLKLPNVVPISINESLFESALIDEEFILPDPVAAQPSNFQVWHVHVADLLLALWLIGAIFLGIYILARNIRFRNAIKKEPLLTEKRALDLLEACRNRMKSHTPLKITVTDKIKSPALFGYIRPRLLFPAGVFEKLNDADLTYIFMHELGHLKRHDIGMSWIITFLQVFQWFNPFVWLAFYQMRIDQESACDASVLSRIKHDQNIDYAGTIVGFLEKFYRNHKLPALVGILENQTQIKMRITRIINYRKYSKSMMLFSSMLLITIGVVFFSLACFSKVNHDRPVLESSVSQSLPVEFQKEPVVEDVDTRQRNETTIFTADTQQEPVADKERVARDEVKQEKQNLPAEKIPIDVPADKKIDVESVSLTGKTKNNPVAVKKRAVRSEPLQAEQNPQTRKIAVAIQDKDIEKDDRKEVRSAAETQKAHTDALRQLKDVYNTYSDNNIDILKYYQFAASKYEQSAKEALIPKKGPDTGKEKVIKYPDLAGPAYHKQENPDNAKETPVLPVAKSIEGKIHSLKDVDERPRILRYYSPRYPFEARMKGIEGRVLLRFIVDNNGKVIDPQVVSAKPEGVFEKAALETVVKYRLKPAIKDGTAVSSVVKLAISFAIDDNYQRFAQR